MSVFKYQFLSFLLLISIPVSLSAQETEASLVEKGANAEKMGLKDRAEQYYRQALQMNPEGSACLPLGIMLERKELYSEAADLLQYSKVPEGFAHLALCLSELEFWDSASAIAEIAIEQGEKASPMATMALCESMRGHQANAYSWAAKSIEADPRYARAYNVMGVVCYRKGSDNEALRNFRKAVQLDSNDVDAFYNLGTMYCLRNNYESALTTLKKALKKHPKSLKLYYCLGAAYRLRGDYQKAVMCYEEVLKIDSSNLKAFLMLGDVSRDQGEYDRAQSYYNNAVRINPRYAPAYKGLGRTYTLWNNYSKAIHSYQKAVQIDPNDADTYCLIADLYKRQGNAQREQNSYKKAARLGNQAAQQWLVKKGLSW